MTAIRTAIKTTVAVVVGASSQTAIGSIRGSIIASGLLVAVVVGGAVVAVTATHAEIRIDMLCSGSLCKIHVQLLHLLQLDPVAVDEMYVLR